MHNKDICVRWPAGSLRAHGNKVPKALPKTIPNFQPSCAAYLPRLLTSRTGARSPFSSLQVAGSLHSSPLMRLFLGAAGCACACWAMISPVFLGVGTDDGLGWRKGRL